LPYEQDTADFHARFKAACDAHDPAYHARFKAWDDDYFFIPHRKVHRGVGGIFYDHLECADDAAFEELCLHPRRGRGVSRRLSPPGAAADEPAVRCGQELQMLEWRGRYAEFNLVHDRGTLFGLKTGGNIDAILMIAAARGWS
jgi:coproporphyrinogen III oxidase